MHLDTAPYILSSELAVVCIQEGEKRIRLHIEVLQGEVGTRSPISTPTRESPFLSPSEVVVSLVVIVIYYYYYKSEIVAVFAQKFCMKYCVIFLCFII